MIDADTATPSRVILPIPQRRARGKQPDIVDLLVAARARLWNGSQEHRGYLNRYICDAIYSSCCSSQEFEVSNVLSAIHDGIYPVFTYEAWLKDAYNRQHDDVLDIQAARLRWVNQLIEEYGGVL